MIAEEKVAGGGGCRIKTPVVERWKRVAKPKPSLIRGKKAISHGSPNLWGDPFGVAETRTRIQKQGGHCLSPSTRLQTDSTICGPLNSASSAGISRTTPRPNGFAETKGLS